MLKLVIMEKGKREAF